MNKIFDERKLSTFRDFKDLVRSNKLIGRREICIVVDRLELENIVYKAEEYNNIKREKNKEIERLNNIIDELDKLIEQYSKNEYYYKYNGKYLKSEIINDLKNLKENKIC